VDAVHQAHDRSTYELLQWPQSYEINDDYDDDDVHMIQIGSNDVWGLINLADGTSEVLEGLCQTVAGEFWLVLW